MKDGSRFPMLRPNASLRLVTLSLLLFLASGVLAQDAAMSAHFVAVGQAHATLLEFPCGAVLIDAGSQDDAHTDALVTYLKKVFERRTDLGNTLDSIIITHNHIDHTKALKAVVQNFTVKKYIDNGLLTGAGRFNPIWIRDNKNANGQHIEIRDIKDEDIPPSGLTDGFIDPLTCAYIKLLHGRLDDNPGWSNEVFDNQNNQGIVIRVDFGASSLLFMGDLQEEAISQMLTHIPHASPNPFDADVYQVGHHGSANATTAELLAAVTPQIAVIPVGEWDFGKGSNNQFTTFAYGHPRKATVDLLTASISGKRSAQVKVKVATAAKKFKTVTVKKKIYATAWDGNVVVNVTTAHTIDVTTNN